MGRGVLTEEIKALSNELLGYEITQKELRLMPYIQYCVLNSQNIDIGKVNAEERKILQSWKEKKYIDSPASDLRVTKEFWDIVNEILWVGYVVAEGRNL